MYNISSAHYTLPTKGLTYSFVIPYSRTMYMPSHPSQHCQYVMIYTQIHVFELHPLEHLSWNDYTNINVYAFQDNRLHTRPQHTLLCWDVYNLVSNGSGPPRPLLLDSPLPTTQYADILTSLKVMKSEMGQSSEFIIKITHFMVKNILVWGISLCHQIDCVLSWD